MYQVLCWGTSDIHSLCATSGSGDVGWSETCDAWRLPMVQNVFHKYPPMFCVVKGCRVNLKDPRNHQFLGKGWKLATTHEGLARSMQLPCMRTQRHAPCQGSLTRMSAYYTDDFAKRVCRAILQSQNQTEVYQELVGKREPPKGFVGYPKECTCETVCHPKSVLKCNLCERGKEKGEQLSLVGDDGDDDMIQGPLTPEEHDRCLGKIALLHRNTGHGPIEHLVTALQARRADPRVIELARTYECPICQETKRQVPRSEQVWNRFPQNGLSCKRTTLFGHTPKPTKRFNSPCCLMRGVIFGLVKSWSRVLGLGLRGTN